jgi:hypothetical protein
MSLVEPVSWENTMGEAAHARLLECSPEAAITALGRKNVYITCNIKLIPIAGLIHRSAGYMLALKVLAHRDVGPKQKLLNFWN